MKINHTYTGDALEVLLELPDASVHCCVTSPPYWGLRDYGVNGQVGMESSPQEYVGKMVAVFREVRRVLRDDGTLWLNLGDSYCASGKNRSVEQAQANSTLAGRKHGSEALRQISKRAPNLKLKDLVGIPWMVAFALRDDGWYLRQDIIWSKPNCMPESVRDRCTKSHEYIFLLSKSPKYYYDQDAIKKPAIYGEPSAPDKIKSPYGKSFTRKARQRAGNKSMPSPMKNGIRPPKTDKQRGHGRRHAGFNDRWDAMTKEEQCTGMRNKRSVWTVSPAQFKEAHFATFPEKLIVDCIKAGCPEGGIVLDPFCGANTTGLVAKKLHRNYIGIEINPDYVKMGNKRLRLAGRLFDETKI